MTAVAEVAEINNSLEHRYSDRSRVGISSAGAGALGTVLLLNYSDMTPTQVIGTDLLLGLVLAGIGSAFHWRFGSVNSLVLAQLLIGGIPGVLVGCLFIRRVPARRLKLAIANVAILPASS